MCNPIRNTSFLGSFILLVLVLVACSENTVVTPITKNTPPSAAGQTVTLSYDTDDTIIITLEGSDPEVDALLYNIVQNPLHGTLSGSAPVLTYTPASGYSGTDNLIYKVSDGELESAPATVTIEIRAKQTTKPADTTQPECRVEEVTGGSLHVFTQDPHSGLARIKVLLADNATVTIDPFAPGSTAPVTVRADKIDLTQKARLELKVVDNAGNYTLCDPIIVNLAISEGNLWGRTSVQVADIPQLEHIVRIDNGVPGAQSVRIKINDGATNTFSLTDGAKTEYNALNDMQAAKSSASIVMHGTPGSSVVVMFHDGSASLAKMPLTKSQLNLNWY